jgi:hypothetical protein
MIFDLMVLKDRGHAALQVPLTPAGRMGWALQTHRRDRVADALPDRLDTDLLSSDGNGLAPFLDARGHHRPAHRAYDPPPSSRPGRPAAPVRESRRLAADQHGRARRGKNACLVDLDRASATLLSGR